MNDEIKVEPEEISENQELPPFPVEENEADKESDEPQADEKTEAKTENVLEDTDEISILRTELDSLKKELDEKKAAFERMNRDIGEFSEIFPNKSINSIPDSVWESVKSGIPLAAAYALYEKKRRYALVRKSKLSVVITVLALAIAVSFVMLISNQFKYGAYVIATPSMTGELNKGDVALYEQLEDRPIEKGEVIAFDKDGIVVIHRVEKIETVNGITRYYTKGDANDDMDAGYIHRSSIIGLVNFKIPYIGYPTLWMRNVFKK